MASRLQSSGTAYVQRSSSGGLYEVIDVILDKGLVVDVFLRVSLVGIELLTVDARIVIATSIPTCASPRRSTGLTFKAVNPKASQHSCTTSLRKQPRARPRKHCSRPESTRTA